MTLIMREYVFLTPDLFGDGYEKVCLRAGLKPIEGGWGLLLCTDGDGQHATGVTEDVKYLRLLVEGNAVGDGLGDLEIPGDKFPFRRDAGQMSGP